MTSQRQFAAWVRVRQSGAAAVLAAITVLATLVLTYSQYVSTHVIGADLSTYLLPAHARSLDLGNLYVDYFDIKPPLTYGLFVPWIAVMGSSLVSMWALYLIFLVALFAGMWLLLREIIGPWISLAIFASLNATIIGTGLLEDLFFVTEVVGLSLMLMSCWIALKWGRSKLWVLCLASFISGLSGQVKEIFILAPLVLIGLAIQNPTGKLRGITALFVGWFAALAATVLVLFWWGPTVFAQYLDVLSFKQRNFPSPSAHRIGELLTDYVNTPVTQWLPLLPVFLLGSLLLIVYGWRKGTYKNIVNKQIFAQSEFLVILLFGTFTVGLLWQGKTLYGHYALPYIFTLFLLIAVIVKCDVQGLKNLSRKPRIIILIFLIICLVPSISSMKWTYGRVTTFDLSSFVINVKEAESPSNVATFDLIKKLSKPDECIQVAYGWSASSYYLYSDRKPCSRFVVPPLWTDANYQAELRRSLVENPPRILVLDQTVMRESGIPGKDGSVINREVFPFDTVANQCYSKTENPVIFVEKFANPVLARSCIETALRVFA